MNAKKATIKPSDARSWILCKRRVWFDNYPPDGEEVKIDPFDELMIEKGVEHEKTVLNNRSQGKTVKTAQSVEHTKQLMNAGIDVIYQAQLDDEHGLVGRPDFLIKHESGKYQPADAKLAKSTKNKEWIKIQLGIYRRLLGTDLPGLVFLGNDTTEEIDDTANPIVDKFLKEMDNILKNDELPSVRYAHSRCSSCPYFSTCRHDFTEKDEITLVYDLDSRSVDDLEAAGIDSVHSLSEADPANIPDVPYLKGFDKKQKAVLQAKSWLTDKIYKLSNFELPEGTWIHFDIENNPLDPSGSEHVYLWGFLKPDYEASAFEYVWTDTMADDRQGWEKFLALIEKYKSEYPDLIIAHYASHEKKMIKKYATQYDMLDHHIVAWLLGEDTPLYDIRKPVLENLILPLQGYGLKDICKHKDLVNFQWENEESGSQWSVVQFNKFQQEKDEAKRESLKKDILGYNKDDVLATRKLEEWLRGLQVPVFNASWITRFFDLLGRLKELIKPR